MERWVDRQKNRAAEAARIIPIKDLRVRFLVTFRALRRGLLALGVFGLVAIDADTSGSSGVVESSLRLGLHRGSGSGGVAILACFMRSLGSFFGLGGMMAGVALRATTFMSLVIELHAAHRCALQDYRSGCSFSRISNHGHHQHHGNKYS